MRVWLDKCIFWVSSNVKSKMIRSHSWSITYIDIFTDEAVGLLITVEHVWNWKVSIKFTTNDTAQLIFKDPVIKHKNSLEKSISPCWLKFREKYIMVSGYMVLQI